MKRFISALILLATLMSASAWGSKGHKAIAYMAKRHLSTEAYEALNQLFEGNSIVYYASWLDQAAYDPEYSYTSKWHYINVDPWETFETRSSLAGIDAVVALYNQTAMLKSDASTNDEKVFAAKVLIHVVGDIHQPLHCGHGSDAGGNSIKLTYEGESTNLHSLWDYLLVEDAHPWSYYEWVSNLDHFTEAEIKEISAGTFDDWAKESMALAATIYQQFPRGYNASIDDAEEWTPAIEHQFCAAGLRLAALMNEIFSPSSAPLISADATTEADSEEFFTITGIRVSPSATLPPGIYITSRNRKLIIRR